MSTPLGSTVLRSLLAAWASLAFAISPAEPIAVDGAVTAVTLYRGQALVTRTVSWELTAGSHELTVGGLPQHVVDGSLFAESDDGIEIRAVRLRQNPVAEEPRDDVREVDLQLAETNDAIQLNEKQRELLDKRTTYLDSLEGFVAPTAKADLASGVLDATALQEVTTFSFDERRKIAEEQVDLIREQRELRERLQLLEATRAELARGQQRTVSEAILFVEVAEDAAGTIRLGYLAGNCGWQPTYTFRADREGGTTEVEYAALVQQMTGEDWQDVSLTLSTASPALSAAGPGLAPFYVTLDAELPVTTAQPEQPPAQQQAQVTEAYRGLQARKSETNRLLLNTYKSQEFNGLGWNVNAVANDMQCLELLADTDALAAGREAAQDGPSLAYALEGPVSLASRADQQMLRIMKAGLPTTFAYVAVPVLSQYVYREGTLHNTSDQDLLAGPIVVHLDGRFVGRGEIPTVSRGETFTVGFGADPQLRTDRELVTRKEGVQGGNREVTFTYRLSIENFSGDPASVRLFDRLPVGERPGELRVTLASDATPLSTDAAYLRSERPKGILRWDVDVPPTATLEQAHVVDYSFTIDHDRQFRLQPARSSAEQQRVEFEQLQRDRVLKR